MNPHIKKVVDIHGSQKALADVIGVKPVQVFKWLHSVTAVPSGRCLAIEAASKKSVTRYELRPDVFGSPPKRKKSTN